ncbi:MAG: glycogen/starch synthase [Patescibacteria group bacterium]
MEKNKGKKLKILMVSSEVAPFAKVGGLADVVGSLPKALVKLGCEVRVIMPLYGVVDRKKYKIKKIFSNIEILSSGKKVKINLWRAIYNGVLFYFIEENKFFGRKIVYLGNSAERFLFFSLACLRILPIVKFMPNVIHCHDFHTALITDLIKASGSKIKTLYTIHNLNYQGKSEIEVLTTGNLTKHSLESLTRDAQDGDINFMQQGIVNADLVNTVSPTYAKEISQESYGAGLEKIIRANKHKITGIINGIDFNLFNPATDKFIKKKYSIKSLSEKEKNKLALQKMVGLPQDKNICLAGFISRLAWQKGVELFTERMIKEISESDKPCQFVFLGTGQKEYETYFKSLAKIFPKYVSAEMKFDIKLAQQIYAGSDMFLMPSRFEPCGLGQMIAMRYGTVPVVRETGGLTDTVDKKVGFKFNIFKSRELQKAINNALDIYYKKPRSWKKLQNNCMKKDFSWDKSARDYLRLYKKLVTKL